LPYVAVDELSPVDAAVNVVTIDEASTGVRPLWPDGFEAVSPAVSALTVTPPPRTSTPLVTAAVSTVFLVVLAFSTVMNRTVSSKRNTRYKGLP
jgi:hypothetical protein